MERYISYTIDTDDANELLFQKRTDTENPEYQLEIRDCYNESLIVIEFTAKKWQEVLKAANALKRED